MNKGEGCYCLLQVGSYPPVCFATTTITNIYVSMLKWKWVIYFIEIYDPSFRLSVPTNYCSHFHTKLKQFSTTPTHPSQEPAITPGFLSFLVRVVEAWLRNASVETFQKKRKMDDTNRRPSISKKRWLWRKWINTSIKPTHGELY